MAELSEVQRSLGRIEGKLDAALARMEHHEERITSTERRVWTFSGIAAVIGAALGIGGSHGLKL